MNNIFTIMLTFLLFNISFIAKAESDFIFNKESGLLIISDGNAVDTLDSIDFFQEVKDVVYLNDYIKTILYNHGIVEFISNTRINSENICIITNKEVVDFIDDKSNINFKFNCYDFLNPDIKYKILNEKIILLEKNKHVEESLNKNKIKYELGYIKGKIKIKYKNGKTRVLTY